MHRAIYLRLDITSTIVIIKMNAILPNTVRAVLTAIAVILMLLPYSLTHFTLELNNLTDLVNISPRDLDAFLRADQIHKHYFHHIHF